MWEEAKSSGALHGKEESGMKKRAHARQRTQTPHPHPYRAPFPPKNERIIKRTSPRIPMRAETRDEARGKKNEVIKWGEGEDDVHTKKIE